MATVQSDHLQTVLDMLPRVAELSLKKRADLTSAIHVFCRDLQRRPAEIPARIDVVEQLGRQLRAARLGLTQGSLNNVKSRVRIAMRLTGHTDARCRLNLPLGPVWHRLLGVVTQPHDRIALVRLFRIFQLKGVEPCALSVTVFDGVRRYLHETGASRPDTVYRNMVSAWNRLNSLPALVSDLTIEVPNRSKAFSLRLEELPATLAADINDWLAAEQGVDPRLRRARLNRPGLRYRKPIRSVTAASYLQLMLQFITMQTRAGVPLTNLKSLADVVTLEHIDHGLAQYERHFGNEKRRHLGQVMRVVGVVARRWVGLGSEELAELRAWTRDVAADSKDMTPKNKSMLRSLRDPHALARLLGLGPKIMKETLAKSRIREVDAIRAQVAFATTLLLNAPARIRNIASIHLDRHLRRVGVGADERIFLEFCAAEVKNELDLRYELNELTKNLLVPYLARVRPKLTRDPGNRSLFPGEGDGPKHSPLLSAQIANLTEEIVGTRVTAHQFRHVIGFLHLARSGNDIATVAKALGNSESTARQFYAWISREEALRNWDLTLKLKQEELAPLINGTTSRPRRRRRTRS